MLIAIILLVIILVLVLIIKEGPSMCYDDEIETVTTTTTTHEEEPQINIVGNLKRQFGEGNKPQAFVIDPVDQQKIWLNSNDDMYEDADGKIWRLV